MKKILLVVLLIVLLTAGCSARGNTPYADVSYADLIFDTTRIHTIDIIMSEEDRTDQLSNPKEKTKYKVTVVVDGEEFGEVAFHTKGNSSLYFTADAGKDKFSYKIAFDKYLKDQTYHGLDKLNLQCNCGDATAMKEFMAFWLFNRMGVDAPLASYVWLTVNGEDQGLYTALEEVGDSFLVRTADGEGTLYKPEAEDLALDDDEMESIVNGNSIAHDSDGGADLTYKDDNEKSYPDIFDNAETDDDEETRARVIRALKALAEKKDLEKYLDTEEIIKYFAVNNYLVSYDSYTGLMLHNYYLYEHGGRLAMLPWDYDSAYGGFPMNAVMGQPADSSAVINAGIDSPLGSAEEEKRPMWSWILSDETYLDEYHDALSEIVEIIESGEYGKEAERVYELILPYIEKDAKTYYSAKQSRKGFETLLKFSELRAESICKQISGQLASRSEQQAEKDMVDASGISIRDLGSLEDLVG